MEKYKIKINNDVEAKECSALMKELGYKEDNKFSRFTSRDNFGIACSDGSFGYGHEGMTDEDDQELTIHQLRDLVVLKRNDVKDATHTHRGDAIYRSINGFFYVFRENLGRWVFLQHMTDDDEDLELVIRKSKPQDPALISGADAELVAQAKKFITSDHLNRFEAAEAHLEGHPVQFMLANGDFIDITSDTTLGIFEKDGGYSFRIKPTTLKVNAELPKPNKETQHNSLVYAVTYEFKTREERNAFADKLRGTNS